MILISLRPLVLQCRCISILIILPSLTSRTVQPTTYRPSPSIGTMGGLQWFQDRPFRRGRVEPCIYRARPTVTLPFCSEQYLKHHLGLYGEPIHRCPDTRPGSPFPCGDHPVALLVDATGDYLFSLHSGSNDLWTYVVHPSTGLLTKLATTSLSGASSPSQLAMDISGRFLYVASSTTQQIYGFIFDNSKGTLTAVNGSPFPTGHQQARSDWLWIVRERGSSLPTATGTRSASSGFNMPLEVLAH